MSDKASSSVTNTPDISEKQPNYPKRFLSLFSSTELENINDALTVFLHAALLDVGFLPKNVPEPDCDKCMPQNWKANGVFKVQYFHKSLPQHFCLVTFLPLAGNFIVDGLSESRAVSEYVHSMLKMHSHIAEDSNLSNPDCLFLKPEELAIYFKDAFCFPLLVLLLNSSDSKQSFGLSGLVPEIQMSILQFLPVESIISMSSVNKHFKHLASSPILWKFLLRRDYSSIYEDLAGKTSQPDWKQEYKSHYQLQRSRSREDVFPLYYHDDLYCHVTPHFPPLRGPFDPDYDLHMMFPRIRDPLRPHSWLFNPAHHPYYRDFRNDWFN